MAIESITKALGSGSGIDTGALVTSLLEAQFAAKTAALTAKSDALTAQISGVSKLRSAITGFDAALSTLIGGGTLASKLTSSNEAAVKATALPGADLSNLSASVSVTQLASAQVSTTNAPVARDAVWRRGTLSLQMGRDVVDANGAATGFTASGGAISISIATGDTIDDIAAKINAGAKGSVTASVVTDGAGVRLVMRSASGADQAFELTGTNGVGGSGLSLAGLAVSRTSTVTTSATRARDSIVQIDGVRYTRPTNSVEGVVPGVKLDLLGVTTTPATLSMTRPTSALSTAVSDFVATYNEMLAVVKEENDPASGPLRADSAVASMARSLRTLTTAVINPSTTGAPRTLADLGVATARDGTLSVDAKRLASTLAKYPDALETMFASGGGLSAALSKIAAQATDKTYGLDAATTRYTREVGRVAEAQEKLAEATEVTRTRLTRQFASMDARVAAYKSTQTFLTGQIAAWNKSDS